MTATAYDGGSIWLHVTVTDSDSKRWQRQRMAAVVIYRIFDKSVNIVLPSMANSEMNFAAEYLYLMDDIAVGDSRKELWQHMTDVAFDCCRWRQQTVAACKQG